jgi:excisionase family DNA binding protein
MSLARARLYGGDMSTHAGDDMVDLSGRAPGPAGDDPTEPTDPTGEISTGQAADLLGISRRTVVQLIERGELEATRIGTRRRLEAADVLALRERARSQRTATLRDVVAASRDLDLYR